MKVVVAYCQLHPKTVAAVWDSADELDEIVWGDTSKSDTAYYELIAEHWAIGDPFVVLEQDKIPAQCALRDLHDCEHQWCTYPVPMAHNGQPCDFVSLSCTKFGAALIAGAPDFMERVAKHDLGFGPMHWNRLDMVMALECTKALARLRLPYQCHWHPAGMVGHEHQAAGALL